MSLRVHVYMLSRHIATREIDIKHQTSYSVTCNYVHINPRLSSHWVNWRRVSINSHTSNSVESAMKCLIGYHSFILLDKTLNSLCIKEMGIYFPKWVSLITQNENMFRIVEWYLLYAEIKIPKIKATWNVYRWIDKLTKLLHKQL